jgi:transposase
MECGALRGQTPRPSTHSCGGWERNRGGEIAEIGGGLLRNTGGGLGRNHRRFEPKYAHQDADLGYGWAKRGERFWVASSSPGLSARVSFYGLYLDNEGQVRLWPFPRANGEHTIEVLRRLRAAFPDEALIVLWDGAPYHRAQAVREAATALNITLMPLPGYSPDLMPVEALWRWLREDVTYHHCHACAEDLTRRVADFEARLNQDPFVVADRLWTKDRLDPEEEKLRFSK